MNERASHSDPDREPGVGFEPGELAALLAPGGAVHRVLEGFEERPEQQAMIEAVGRAFVDERLLLVEAGTGTGKSLAYGLPAALWARASGGRVVISTGTINLQEQLVGKDLPLVGRALRHVLGRGLQFTLVKGRSNYLCRRRLEDRLRQRGLLSADELTGLLDALAAWTERSPDGSRSDLDFALPEEIWELVCSDADACLGRRCGLREDCFFAHARQAAEQAELLVVNHHLLFADLALRRSLAGFEGRAVLPAFDRVILDEGHGLEDVASGFFGLQLTRGGVSRALRRLQPARSQRAAGRLAWSTALGAGVLDENGGLARLAGQARQACEAAFDGLVDFAERRLPASAPSERRLRLTPALLAEGAWTTVHEGFGQAARRIDELSDQLERLADRIENLGEDDGRAAEGRAGLRRLAAIREALGRLSDPPPADEVRWVELPAQSGSRHVRLASAPLDVGAALDRALFSTMRSVVITSATLSVGGSFEYLSARLGVDRSLAERVRCLQVDSPFDYPRQARLAVPQDAPLPTEPAFEQWLPEAILRLVTASQGGALVLFTAWGLMTRCFELVRERLEQAGLEPLCQGQAPRDKLLHALRSNRSAVLFGTDSFWQGVDVAGDCLRLVIIARLPFDVPSEPLFAARAERIEAQGRSAFSEYSLPRAVLKLKQGFGRLIRSRADRGAVVLLDRRVVGRSYGARFLLSLPPADRLDGDLDELCLALAGFFADSGGPTARTRDP